MLLSSVMPQTILLVFRERNGIILGQQLWYTRAMKLIQVNIWQGRLLRNLLEFLTDEQPDIICMQEVLSCQNEVLVWDMVRGLESVRAAIGLEHVFYAPTWGFQMMGECVQHGNAIFSRYPLLDRQTIFTNGHFEEEAINRPGINNVRNAQIAKVQLKDKELTLANHHGHWEPNSLGTEVSKQRLEPFVEALKPIKGPLIVAGDFNLDPQSEALQYFEAALQLRNLTREHHVETTLSEFGHSFKVACDNVFLRGEATAQRFEVSNRLVSDHKAVVLEFELS
jgi:endonuclease/exonuclease/phosphatase family metal-dependent hydrolase